MKSQITAVLTKSELYDLLLDYKKQMFSKRLGKRKMGFIEKTHELRFARREIARIKMRLDTQKKIEG